MTKVTVTTIGNQTFLNLFNSCEIFSVKVFDTERKARNFAKKWNYTIYEVLPLGIKPFEYCN